MPIQIKNRAIPGDQQRDPSSIDNLTYNERAGARKSMDVGRALLPIPIPAGAFSTDASTKRILPSAGMQLAIYNNSAAVHAVTVGDGTVTAQAAGAVQTAGSPTAPFVGVACTPNSWTYLATGQWNNVVTDSALLLVYIVDDPSYIVTQPANNAAV